MITTCLVMGHTQGKGCYCFVNGLSICPGCQTCPELQLCGRGQRSEEWNISAEVSFPALDTVILVSDCSRRGIQAVGRIARLVPECGLKPKKIGLIVNRAPKGVLNDGVREEIEKQNLELLGVVPQDEGVYEFDSAGTPTTQLPEDNPVRQALYTESWTVRIL